MKELLDRRLLALPALAVFFTGACYHHHRHDGHQPSVPTYFEFEPNDDPFTANDFGVLVPGDHFFIDGFISDSGFDPFDGFWFTSAQPIHVDFQLFTDNPSADLDICLYDPVLDQTISCWETANNPEQGGVDVTGGNVDFQLVVNSFIGSSDYALEIVVYSLPAPLPVTADGSAPAPGARPALVATGGAVSPVESARREASGEYSRAANPTETRTEVRSEFTFDAATGLWFETHFVEHVEVPRQPRHEKIR